MARRKDQSPLFEIIRGTQGGQDRPRIELPPWLSAGNNTASDQAAKPNASKTSQGKASGSGSASGSGAKGASVSASSVSPTAPQGTKPAAKKADGTQPSSIPTSSTTAQRRSGTQAAPGESSAWLATEVDLRLTRLRLGVVGLSAAALVMVVYLGAYRLGMANGQDRPQEGQQIASLAGGGEMSGIADRMGAGDPGSAESASNRATATARSAPLGAQNGTHSARLGGGTGSGAARAVVGGGIDTRRSGMNYYVLETMDKKARSYGDEIVAYLAANGVDAAVVPANDNGSSSMVTVVVLEGFEGPSSPVAKRLKDRLLHLGRGWKQQGGARDWHDMYGRLYKGTEG